MRARAAAFTLSELLVVIAIILVLAGLLLPAVNLVRNSSRRAQTNATLQMLFIALQDYRDADAQKRFPPDDPLDHFLRADGPSGAVVSVGSLINPGERDDPLATQRLATDLGFRSWIVDPQRPGKRILTDAWGRPYRYQVDANHDGVASRPAPLTEWNPPVGSPAVSRDVYAYVWSLGVPKLGQAPSLEAADPDADPAAAARWLWR